jgi:hypothetical protein
MRTAWTEERILPDHRPAFIPVDKCGNGYVALLCLEVAIGLGTPVVGSWFLLRWMGW